MGRKMEENTLRSLSISFLLFCCTALVVSCTSLNTQKKQYKYNPERDWWLKEVMKSKQN